MHSAVTAHFPQVSPIVQTMIPVVKDLGLFAAITAIGLFFADSFLIEEKHGFLTKEGIRIRNLARFATLVWFICVIGNVVLEISNLLAQSIADSLDFTVFRSFVTQTSVGRGYLFQLIVSALILVILPLVKKVGGSILVLASALAALLIPLFQSHASSAGNHGLAIGSIIFHVGAISLWVGGVIAMAAISPKERSIALPRFSAVAFWCALIVGTSGVVNAYTRLDFKGSWNSLYAVLVGLKVLLMAVLLAIGSRHRKYLLAKDENSTNIFQLLTAEIFVMAMTVAVGGWLSTSSPPLQTSKASLNPSIGLVVTGIEPVGAPSFSRILFAYVPVGVFLGFLILITALYVKGVLTLSRRGDKWPVGRTVSFALAIAVSDYATSGGIGVYAHFAFSYHMVAHMILGMIAPIGFILSAPITLALRTLPIGRTSDERGIRATFLAFLHSRYSLTMTNPLVALTIFDGSLFLLYMTPLFGHLMQSHSGHVLMNIHFLLAGFLFFHVIVGIDPNPNRVPHLVRIILLFGAMSMHAFFSIALMSNSSLIDQGYFASIHRTWNLNLLADQHNGGAVGWAMGEIPILIALIATFIQWIRDDTREAKRLDRASDRAMAMGEDDELATYNKYLAGLNQRDLHQQE